MKSSLALCAPNDALLPSHQEKEAKAPALWLSRLALSDFRAHAALAMDMDWRAVILTGPNGGGKTSLLEAISFLAPGRGLRRARHSEAARHEGDGGWAIAATLEGERPLALGTALAGGEKGKRKVKIDGKAASGPSAFGECLRLLWACPDMDRIFSESASARLRFLDRITASFDPQHARHAAAYERAKRQRQALIRKDGYPQALPDPEWLDALEATMAEKALPIAAARAHAIQSLSSHMKRVARAGFPHADLYLEGDFEERARTCAQEASLWLTEALRRQRDEDGASMRCSAGPHRALFYARHHPSGSDAAHASTGEQKAMLLSVLLAAAHFLHQEKGESPILLLDEALAHLDVKRRNALFSFLGSMRAQYWVTGANPQDFQSLFKTAQIFSVSPGAIARLPEAAL